MPHAHLLGECAGEGRVADDEGDGEERGKDGKGVIKEDGDKQERERGE
jgi:hypothetical protein